MSRETFREFRGELMRLGRTLPENLLVLRTISSTNQVARDIVGALPLQAYPPAPCLVVAYEQTRGRGRFGRSWVSPAGGGLYCSLVHPLEQREAPPALPLEVAVAICGAIRRAGVADCKLEWPNDLVVDGGKLGGILIEVSAPQPRAPATAVIGFGVNLRGDAQALEAFGGTTMERAGARLTTAAELLAVLATPLREVGRRRVPTEEIMAAYRRMVRHRAGDVLSCRLGDEMIRGRYVDVDESGHLLLDTSRGRRVLAVGDIIES